MDPDSVMHENSPVASVDYYPTHCYHSNYNGQHRITIEAEPEQTIRMSRERFRHCKRAHHSSKPPETHRHSANTETLRKPHPANPQTLSLNPPKPQSPLWRRGLSPKS